ncbi:hypothetical protein OJ253_2264 [Cryptosporidium canis]|uniref:Ribosome biogenesis protein NSA1 n=1 Tax=Cryptosporidium canis TaxID=195482 RepID=A0A9D5HWY7_9CRYT|nr:hypothetical protein OJ253_2264 [Cryptosporidium canis]
MKHLYSGDLFGTIKEYDISKIMNSDESYSDSIIEYSNKSTKNVSFIYIDNLDFKLKYQSRSGMFIGYSDGTISFISVPFRNDLNVPKITFKLPGEVIFIHDITLRYPNEFELGNRVIVAITGMKKLYLIKFPQTSEYCQQFESMIYLDDTDQPISYSLYVIRKFELPCTNINCAAYNGATNSIAFGGYESDIKIVNLDTMDISWSSKNLKANALKHRVPVDVRRLAFVEEYPELLLCGTGYGEIRLYAPQIQRRPIINYTIWEDKSPVTSLEVIKKWGILKSNKSSNGSIFAIGNNKGSALLLRLSNTPLENGKKLNLSMDMRDSALNKKKTVSSVRETVPFNISTEQLGNKLKKSVEQYNGGGNHNVLF